MNPKRTYSVLSVILALILWQVFSHFFGLKDFVSSPYDVFEKLFVFVFDKDFYLDLLFSSMLVLVSLLLSIAISVCLAMVAYRYDAFNSLISPYVNLFNTVPIIAFIPILIVIF